MSEIKVGDLVMVVRNEDCGCTSRRLGIPFTVLQVIEDHGHCAYCGATWGRRWLAELDDHCHVSLWRLKKIPPLTEPESIEHTEQVTV